MHKNFKFSWKVSLVCAALSSLMFWASSWQWTRYKWKVALLESYQENSKSPALTLPKSANSQEDYRSILNRKIKLSGTYDFSKQMIVKNRRDASGPGYWLLTPLKIEGSEKHIIVSRGFIPFKDSAKKDWTKYKEQEKTELYAVVQETVDQMNFFAPKGALEKNDNSKFIEQWLYPDIEEIAKQLPYPTISEIYLQRLGGSKHETFPKEAISVRVPPSTHFGYTIEWALLGIITLIIGLGLQFLGGRKKKTKPMLANNILEKHAEKFIDRTSLRNENQKTLHCFLIFVSIQTCALLATELMTSAIFSKAYAAESASEAESKSDIIEHLGETLDLDLSFKSQEGKTVRLRELTDNRPIMLIPAYYRCPGLCNLTLSGISNLIDDLELKIGKDYKAIVYSINDKEDFKLADEKANNYYKTLKKPELTKLAKKNWLFLTSDKKTSEKLSEQIGFSYKKDGDDFIHAALMVVLSPKGKIARYFYNINFPAKDVKFALVEASDGKIGSTIDKVMLYCFRFDPSRGKYTLAILKLTRIISLIVLVLLVGTIFFLKRKEKTRKE